MHTYLSGFNKQPLRIAGDMIDIAFITCVTGEQALKPDDTCYMENYEAS